MTDTALGTPDMEWHNDGHTVTLRLNKSELEVLEVTCPSDNGGPCASDGRSSASSDGLGCIVQYFIRRFGMECNIGVCPPEEIMAICWAMVGDKRDPDAAQLWFVPDNDEVFYAWMTQSSDPDQSS